MVAKRRPKRLCLFDTQEMNFIYSRNEIWRKYPRANTLALTWCYLIAISNYITYFVNIIYFYGIKSSSCDEHNGNWNIFFLIWVIMCFILSIMICCMPSNNINKFTLIPTGILNMKFYLFNFTIAYLFSFTNVYITAFYYHFPSQPKECKDTYLLFVVSTNLYFLWMNTALVHIVTTWFLHLYQKKKKSLNLDNLRVVAPITNEENECVICFEALTLETIVVKTPCNHFFHNKCLLEWILINNSCPVCRINFGNIV